MFRTTIRKFVGVLTVALLAGCGGGGGGNPVQPPAPPAHTAVNESEPNDFSAQALGAVPSNDFVVAGSAATQGDVDLYSVTLSSAGALLSSLDWTGSPDLELSISNGNGVFIRHVNGASHPEQCKLSLPAGTYTIRVGTFENTATAYSLTLGLR